MNPKEQLLQEIQQSPEILIKEVLDFLFFARSRNYPFSLNVDLFCFILVQSPISNLPQIII